MLPVVRIDFCDLVAYVESKQWSGRFHKYSVQNNPISPAYSVPIAEAVERCIVWKDIPSAAEVLLQLLSWFLDQTAHLQQQLDHSPARVEQNTIK